MKTFLYFPLLINLLNATIGTGGISSASIGGGYSKSKRSNTHYNNSQLNANTINLHSKKDTNIIGANIQSQKSTTLNVEGNLNVQSLQDEEKNKAWADEKGLIDALKEGKITQEQFNQAIRDFVPNAADTVVHIPDTLNSAGNYVDAVLPTTDQERLDTLYGSHEDGSVLQANLATTDAISTATMATGVSTLTKAGVKAVDKSLTKGVDEALDVKINPLDGTVESLDDKPIKIMVKRDRLLLKHVACGNVYSNSNNQTSTTTITKQLSQDGLWSI